MDKKFLTEDEAISEFGLDAEQFHRLVEEGELRALADRGTWKFRRDEISNLIQGGQLTSTSAAGASVGAGPDDFSFLELDEDALSEGATMVKKSSDLPADEAPMILESSEAMVSDSDSDVKIMSGEQSSRGVAPNDVTEAMLATHSPTEPASDVAESDSDVRIADSGLSLEGPDSGLATDSSGVLFSDSGIRTPESGVTLRPVDSGISLEGDSGLTLEESKPDSGLTLDAGDSGIRLEPDSGIQLVPDSGIQLVPDSGIQLSGPDSDMPISAPSSSSGDETQPEFEIDDEIAMDRFDTSDQTAMIALDDDEDAVETMPPTKRAGKDTPSLSETFDSVEEVEDLDIADELEASELDIDAVEDEEEFAEDVLDASDEAFSMSEEGEVSEEALSAESAPAMRAAPREPAWGVLAVLPIAAAALLLAVNSLMLWDGMATMWTGDSGKALSIGIIDVLAGLI